MWIMMLLVIGGTYSNPSVTSVEFANRDACEQAAVVIWNAWKHPEAAIFPKCVAKGSP